MIPKFCSLHEKKMTKLRSPNFHVSRTRLAIYNLPQSMNEKKLKNLCSDAVISRATKQKPVIRQIKFMKSMKSGKVTKNHSRGVAFVEFTEHQHALVALRVLNNNPETFGAEHRPIVEFAIDNVQKLKARKSKLQAQQQESHNDDLKDAHDDNVSHALNEILSKRDNSRKRKSRGESRSVKDSEPNRNENENIITEEASSQEQSHHKMRKNISGNGKTIASGKYKLRGAKQGMKSSEQRQKDNLVKKPDVRSSAKGEMTAFNAHEQKLVEEAGSMLKKRKLANQMEQEEQMKMRKPKKNKDPVGRDLIDKLDVLIEQYKSKFSKQSPQKSNGQKQAIKPLKRWFQS